MIKTFAMIGTPSWLSLKNQKNSFSDFRVKNRLKNTGMFDIIYEEGSLTGSFLRINFKEEREY